jgi:hypothetical protein
MRRWVTAILVAFVCLAGASALPAFQQPTADQKKDLAEANKLKGQVSSQIASRKYSEATATLTQLQDLIGKLKADGLSEKDQVIVTLEKFVENQKKTLDRARSKDAAKKGEAGGDAATPPDAPSSGGVSFVKDIAPILSRNCQRCHGPVTSRSKFSMATFSNLMKGGEKGKDDVVPGKPDESRLVLMLKGEEEPRMPPGRGLRRDLIGTIETWVKQGAKFDGAPKFTTTSTLADMVPTEEEELKARVAAMSESELLDLHKAKAKEHWAAANPAKAPATTETEHFIVVGTLPAAELEQVGEWAEGAARDLGRIFGRSAKESVWRGKLTVHVFSDRHEYTEHAMVVETRDVPREVMGHYYNLIETSYAALAKPGEDSGASLKGLVVEQVTGAYLAAQGETPAWFNAGVGRLFASRSDPKAEIYREYRQRVRDAANDVDLAAAVFDEKGGPDPAVLGFGLVDFLVTRNGDKGLATLATEMRKKVAADKAIQGIYGMDRKTLATAWAQFALKRYPAAKKRG